jgi:hypothetical protein
MTLTDFRWRTANRIRRALGRQAQPRPCCRDPRNLGPVAVLCADATADLTVRWCQACGVRHFTLNADPGRLGVRAS